MLRPPRRRSPYGPQLCAAAAFFLLLLSLSVLHSRLSSPSLPSLSSPLSPLLEDSADDSLSSDDRIDDLDDLLDEDQSKPPPTDDDPDDDAEDESDQSDDPSGLFWDHALAIARRSFGKPSDPDLNGPDRDDQSKIAFGSDDRPVDEAVRDKLDSIKTIEDALLLKAGGGGGESPMRDGWARWLEGKGDFLRRDRMLRSNLELLNPKNHPLLQDPDIPGLNSYTRGDRMMQRAIWREIERVPFGEDGGVKSRVERRRNLHLQEEEEKERVENGDGRRWGYFPGLDPHVSFSEFVDRFLDFGKCSTRIFMVWNSPSWMFGVRQQRGLESLLYHNKDACVVVLSETMELDFFSGFAKDGYKVAVAMPNLDELLKDTPAHVFASVWFEWRKTKHYPVHYSELIRLAALYKYGGVYLDSDVIVLKPLRLLKNSIGVESQLTGKSILNGAVMAFDRHSPFLMECLQEYYSTYDDTRLRWNGADLMARVASRLSGEGQKSVGVHNIIVEPSISFFPISSKNITRYFVAPADDTDRAQQEILFRRILNESSGFHFWNGVTSALVPEPNSLVERLLNQYCIRCLDLL